MEVESDMKQPTPSTLNDVSDMLCSRCHRPFDVTIQQNDQGENETYLQCFTCFYSIKLTRFKPRPEKATIH